MALPENDVEIGVGVVVDNTDPSPKIRAQLLRIEAEQKSSDARQEAEARRHQEAMNRFTSNYGSASFFSGAASSNPSSYFQKAAMPSGAQYGSQPAFTPPPPVASTPIPAAPAASVYNQPPPPTARQIGMAAPPLPPQYNQPPTPTASQYAAMARAAQEPAGPPMPTASQWATMERLQAQQNQQFGPAMPSRAQWAAMDRLEQQQNRTFGPPMPTNAQWNAMERLQAQQNPNYGPPNPTASQWARMNNPPPGAMYGPPNPTAAQWNRMNNPPSQSQQFNQQFNQGQVYGPPNPTTAQQIRMAAGYPPTNNNPPGGGGGGGGANSAFNSFSSDFFRGASGALGQTLQTLQYWLVRLGEIGLKGLITETTVAVGIIVKLTHSFLTINEQFANFENILGSVYKSALNAEATRKQLTTFTANSPVPFEGLADLTKMLVTNPATRASMVKQSQDGTMTDTNGFLQKNLHLMEQMLAYKPEAKPEDVVFALREAMAGQFRSITRRFGVSENTISELGGTNRADLENDPKKALAAIQKTFNAIIDPSAISKMAQQPSKLFQNLLEQVFVIPLLTLGRDTRLTQTGKSLYDSVLTPFQGMLKSASKFFSPDRETPAGREDRSAFQNYAQQMAEPVYSIFTKVFSFMGDTLTRMFGRFGFSIENNPGLSIWERVSKVAVSAIQALDNNIEPLMMKARDVVFRFADIFQKLVNAVAGVLDKYGPFISEHPLGTLALAAGARPALMLGVQTAGSFVRRATEATEAGETGFMGASGVAMGAAGSFMLALLPYILTAAVIAMIYSAIKSHSDSLDSQRDAQKNVFDTAAMNPAVGAPSPNQLYDQFATYANFKNQRLDSQGMFSTEQAKASQTLVDSMRDKLVSMGFSKDDELLSSSHRINPDDLERLQGYRDVAQSTYDATPQLGQRNIAKMNQDAFRGGQYTRTSDSEIAHPGLAGYDIFMGNMLAEGGSSDLSQKLKDQSEKQTKQMNPMAEYAEDAKQIVDSENQINQYLNNLSTKGAGADIAKDLELAQQHLAYLKGHSEGVDPNALVKAANDELMTFKAAVAFDEARVAALKAMDSGKSAEETNKAATDMKLYQAAMTQKAQERYSLSGDATTKLRDDLSSFQGSPEEANTEISNWAALVKSLHTIPAEEIDSLTKKFEENVVYAKQGGSNTDLTVKQRLLEASTKAGDDFAAAYQQFITNLGKDATAQLIGRGFDGFNITNPFNSGSFGLDTGIHRTTTTTTTSVMPTQNPGDISVDTGLVGVNGGAPTQSNPAAVTLVTPSGTKWTNGAKMTNDQMTAASNANPEPLPVPDSPSGNNPTFEDFYAMLKKQGTQPGLTEQDARAQYAQNFPPSVQNLIPGYSSVVPDARAVVPAIQSLQQSNQAKTTENTTTITEDTLATQNKLLDSAVSSVSSMISKAGDTGRGDAEGQEALRQFNVDLQQMGTRFPQIMELMSGLSQPIDSLYQNVTKMGSSSLDVTLQKLATARDIADTMAARLEEMAKSQPNDDAGKAQAQRLTQAANQFRMMSASDTDQIKAKSLSDNPLSSFTQGFDSAAYKPNNYFTDLRQQGIEVANDLSTAFSNSFVGFINGSQTASQAFASFGKSVLDTIAKIASQRAAEAIIDLVAHLGTAALGIGTTGNFNGSGMNESNYSDTQAINIEGHATGGPIFGAGTATSDSILAYLSNGEHVWTAKEVQGVGGHHVVNQMRRSARKYASGGFVSANGSDPTSPSSFGMGGNTYGDSFHININVPYTNSGNSATSGADARRKQQTMADGLQSAVKAEIKKQQRVSGSLYSTRYGN